MMAPDVLQKIKKSYDALSDEASRGIFKRRLLFSLLGDKGEIDGMIYGLTPDLALLKTHRLCFYGAGAGLNWIIRQYPGDCLVVDKYKTGIIDGHPILSLEEFLQRPDYRDYVVMVTVGKTELYREIAEELGARGLRFFFAYRSPQYFDLPALELKHEFFVDAGALDGGTTKYFLDHFEHSHAYVFEPNPAQFPATAETLRGYTNAELFPCGLSDRNGVACFSNLPDDPGSALFTQEGELQADVRRLDDVLAGKPVSFLKMDIEGSELAALRGAEQIIREQKPKLAICVYHKPEDIWEIPDFILSLNPSYKLYLRHYSVMETETVLYAIP